MRKDNNMENLKPCPFCGSTRVYLDTEPCFKPAVYCMECHATCGKSVETREQAVEAWNTRA